MVRTRFAPAPTGYLHVGNIRTALFNFLFARAKGGKFLLRIEDTDPLRTKAVYEKALFDDLTFLGLLWDDSPVRQSERKALYIEHAERLLKEGHAYRCYCSKKRLEELRQKRLSRGLPPVYDRHCLGLNKPPSEKADYVIRFSMPQRRIVFTDGVYGRLEFRGEDIGDFIIVDSTGRATYNLTCVVDDAAMGITHIIRGEDHLSNTPRQIALLQALGFTVPEYIHLPLVTGPDRKPLSKRHTGISIRELREEGYLPLAIVNCVARLGWHIEGLRTLEEMVECFSIERLSKSPSVFDVATLKRLNKAAIEGTGAEELLKYLEGVDSLPEERLITTIEAVKGNAETLVELRELVLSILERPSYGPSEKELIASAREVLEEALCGLKEAKGLDENIFNTIIEGLKKKGRKTKEVFMPLRVALTGTTRGIELSKVITLLGREEAIARIKKALEEVNRWQ